MDNIASICTCFIAAGLVPAIARVILVLYYTGKPLRFKSERPMSTMIVLGSGGHTAEMINILSSLTKDRFSPRFYVAASTDNMSLQKARSFENSLLGKNDRDWTVSQYMQIYRSREVGQSYITSIWTTIVAIVHTFIVMARIKPQVILCNGPGTCVPICIVAFLFKVMGICWSSIFYVESIARVKRLSLSGLLVYKLHMVDQMFVQWPQLQREYPRAQYVGRLM